ncbi:MAG: FdtA/QdtA family cupin domain-containing protein [Planctomycetota bacterium]
MKRKAGASPKGQVVQPVLVEGEQRLLGVRGTILCHLKQVHDPRGRLAVGEVGNGLPFVPRRYFIITDVPNGRIRGEHAHRRQKQFLTCLRGSVTVLVDDGIHKEELQLSTPTVGLYVPPKVWAAQYSYSRNAVLMVLASAPYDPSDYIRDYDEFLQITLPALERRVKQ